LDSIVARRWINSMMVNLVRIDGDGNPDSDTIIPVIDGGTEAFKGHVRVILPRLSPCFECTIDVYTPQVHVNLCTIAHTPRTPEHCIAYAKLIQWDTAKPFGITKEGTAVLIDTDNSDHMKWLYEQAKQRAESFKIQGVTYKLTQGVVKRIIPAIAATNALTAAASANEAFKLATSCSDTLNNYVFYNGVTGIYTHSYEASKKDDCPICGITTLTLRVSSLILLKEFIDKYLVQNPKFQLQQPSLRGAGKTLYMRAPKQLEEATRPNLDLPLSHFVQTNDRITIIDPAYSLPISILINFE